MRIIPNHILETSKERDIDRSELPSAEEAFFCGTGWEITPITSVDRLPIGDGSVGRITRRLQSLYFDIVHGRESDHSHWRTAVSYNAAFRRRCGVLVLLLAQLSKKPGVRPW